MAKRGPAMDRDRVARIVVDAQLLGDSDACERHNVHRNTLLNYKRLVASDPALVQLCAEKLAVAEQQWASGLAGALRSGIAFLEKAARTADPTDPDAIEAVAGALKIQADVALTSKMIDARLAGRAGQTGEATRPDPGAGAGDKPSIH